MGKITCTAMSYCIIAVGLISTLIAELLKYKFKQNIYSIEVFQNILFAGILSATSSRQEFYKHLYFGSILLESNITAVTAYLIYHISNAYSLAHVVNI